MMLITTLVVSVLVCCRLGLGVVRLEWCPGCRLKHDFSLQPRHYYSLTAPNLQHTANQEQNECGNQHYSRELLMMGIVMPETC